MLKTLILLTVFRIYSSKVEMETFNYSNYLSRLKLFGVVYQKHLRWREREKGPDISEYIW